MKYTLEEIYYLVGRNDVTSSLTFHEGSKAFKNYGRTITVVFTYLQNERERMEEEILKQPFSNSGYVKVKYLVGGDLTKEQIEQLASEGIHSDDIAQILYFNSPPRNTFNSKEIRSITKIKIPVATLPKGRDIDWMYGMKKKMVMSRIGLCPSEFSFYLACMYYYDFNLLLEDELDEYFLCDGKLKTDIEFELLRIKSMREEISAVEKQKLAEFITLERQTILSILDKYLIESGSSIKKLLQDNKEQAVDFYIKAEKFKQQRLNVEGNIPIFMDLDSYLHIYMRHVKEMKINVHFEHKDNFQWMEEDVFIVMEKIINECNDDIQEFFLKKPNKRYSRYGNESMYFEGDYYSFHIETDGRMDTFYKNRKKST